MKSFVVTVSLVFFGQIVWADPAPKTSAPISVDFPITFAAQMEPPTETPPPENGDNKPDPPTVGPNGQTTIMGFTTIEDPKDHGPLRTLGLAPIASMEVTWADPGYYHTHIWIARAMQELLTSPHEVNFTYDNSQQLRVNPALHAVVHFASGAQSTWWLWTQKGTMSWAIQDQNGKWWWGLWYGYVVGDKPALPLPIHLKKEPDPARTVSDTLHSVELAEEKGIPRRDEDLDFMKDEHAHDPDVIAFFREALTTRGEAALQDLTRYPANIWDDSFVDPLLKVVEERATQPASQPRHDSFSTIFDSMHDLFTLHPQVWSDPSVSDRLGKAVLTAYPYLSDPTSTLVNDNLLGSPEFSTAVDTLSLTRAPSAVAVLQPFLKVKVIDGGDINHRDGYRKAPVGLHVRLAIRELQHPRADQSFPLWPR